MAERPSNLNYADVPQIGTFHGKGSAEAIGSEGVFASIWYVILVLQSRWRLFTATVVLALAVAGFLVVTTPYEYEYRCIVDVSANKIKTSKQEVFLPPSQQIVESISQKYNVGNRMSKAKDLPRLDSVRAVEGMLMLSARAPSASAAAEFLQKTSAEIVDTLNSPLKSIEDAKQLYLNESQSSLDEQQVAMKAYKEGLGRFGSDSDPVFRLLASSEHSRNLQEYYKLRIAVQDARMDLLALQSNRVSIVSKPEPVADGNPVKPRPKMYFGVAFLLGLFLGIGVVWFVESLIRSRQSNL